MGLPDLLKIHWITMVTICFLKISFVVYDKAFYDSGLEKKSENIYGLRISSYINLKHKHNFAINKF